MKIKKLNHILTLALIITLAGTSALLATGKGESGGQFLRIGAGARGPALGNAFSPIVDDASAIYWNPAGLSGMEKKEFTFSYNAYFEDSSSQFIGYAHPMERGTLGVGISMFGVSDIERRSAASGDADTPDLGNFNTRDLAFSVGWASKWRGFDWGAALKYISSDLEAETAQTAAVDLGLKHGVGESNLTLSLAVLNLGGELKFDSEGDPLPLNIKPGAAYKLDFQRMGDLNIILDSEMLVHDGLIFVSPGLEWNAHPMVSLRTGYQFGRDEGAGSGFAAGAGFHVMSLVFDYGFVPFGDLGDTHRVSIGYKW